MDDNRNDEDEPATDWIHFERQVAPLLEVFPEALVATDPTGAVVLANAQAHAVFGYGPNELIGSSVEQLIPARYREAHSELRRHFDEAGPPRHVMNGERLLRGCRQDGSEFPVDVSLSRYVSGGIALTFASVRDVSHTLQLQRELRQAQKMEAIGRLAGGVAHDFNNIITVISSFTTFALEELPEGDPIRQDLDEVLDSANRAQRLISQLLAFSRKQLIEPTHLEVGRALPELEKMLSRLVGEHIRVTLAAAREPCWVFLDRGQLEQIIINLVVNARDAVPSGGMIEIGWRHIDARELSASNEFARDQVELTVRDNGHGIQAQHLPHVFEPFFTTKDKDQGTGLGLSTVYGIVKQNQGDIEVDSTPGTGTVFRIVLPARPPDETERADLDLLASVRPPDRATILVVEDEEGVRRIAKRTLEREGHRVLIARSAAEALMIAEDFEGVIDLLLSDVVLPVMSGPEVADRLAREGYVQRVVFMTGYTDEVPTTTGLVEVVGPVITKPFTPEVLAERVRKALGG